MSTLTSSTRPPSAATSRSRIGPRVRHGAHQAAQKSTTTGTSRDRAITSASKAASFTSLTAAAGAMGGIYDRLRLLATAVSLAPGVSLFSARPACRDRGACSRSSFLSGIRVWYSATSAATATAEGVLDDLVVLAGAQQDADGRALVRLADIAVKRLQIELQLAEMLGLELADLEFDCDQAVQVAVEEQQVEGEIALSDLHRVLGAHEAKVPTQLDEEVLEPIHEPAMQVVLRVLARQVEELDHVGVLEDIEGPGMRLCHQR